MPFRNSPSNNRWNSLKRNASRGLGSLRGRANRGLNYLQKNMSHQNSRRLNNARQNWRSKYRPALRSKFANARRSLSQNVPAYKQKLSNWARGSNLRNRRPSMGRHSSLAYRGNNNHKNSWFRNLFNKRKSSPVSRPVGGRFYGGSLRHRSLRHRK